MLHITGAWAIYAALSLRWIWELIISVPDRYTRPVIGLIVAVLATIPLWFLTRAFHTTLYWQGVLIIAIIISTYILFTGFSRRHAALSFAAVMLAIFIIATFSYTFIAPYTDQTVEDTKFLKAIKNKVPKDAIILHNAAHRGGMDFFRVMFYSPERTILIHNESYLQQKSYIGKTVYLIDRSSREKPLENFGEVHIISQSIKSRRENEHAGKLTLFQVKIKADLKPLKYKPVDAMQAMGRKNGPQLDK